MTGGHSKTRQLLDRAVVLTCLLVLAALLLGHVLGVPILLSYVETGSMEPTIETGDGFVAIPTAGTNTAETGDVVVYEAKELDGGGLTTHRIVDETEHGYVTKGDANPTTDQDTGEPYVTDGQIVATALQVDGSVVTVPHLGTAVMTVESALETAQWRFASFVGTPAVLGTQGLATLLLVFGIVVTAVSLVLDRFAGRDRTRNRSRSRADMFDPRKLVLGIALVLCLVTFATMLATSGGTEIGIVSAEYESERPDVIQTGETANRTMTIEYGGVIPVMTVLEPTSDGVEVDESHRTLHHGESMNATVTISAPDETGYYLRTFGEYRYFAVLPQPVILALHGIHPWVAMTTVTATVVGLVTLPFALLVGTGRIRTRTRERTGPKSGFPW